MTASAQTSDPSTIEIKEANVNYKCCFCGRHEINPVEWGAMYKLGDIVTHYFCLLFSAGIEQNGNDGEGIQGFMPNDIVGEFRRGKRLKCKYCKRTNATIGCGVGRCPISYHYPCGYENGCGAIFHGQFQSFCPKHKPVQEIPLGTDMECPICYMNTEGDEVILPPCCGKQVFHRRCITYSANAAGYAFKCPLCNCTESNFMMAMKINGVYIPDDDAAWETEPNAFQELYTSYSHCDAKKCLCPKGRDFNSKGPRNWCIIRCSDCGHSATHVKCSNLRITTWQCTECKRIEEKSGTRLRNEDVDDGAPVISSEDSGTSELEEIPVASRSRHCSSSGSGEIVDDSRSKQEEEEESISNHSTSTIVQQPPSSITQTRTDEVPKVPKDPTETTQASSTPDITNTRSDGVDHATRPRRRTRGNRLTSRQSRSGNSSNPEAVSTEQNVQMNPSMDVVLVEKLSAVNGDCTREIGPRRYWKKLEEIPPPNSPSSTAVVKESRQELGFEMQGVKRTEAEPSANAETLVTVGVRKGDEDDDVLEIEPDILIEKVVVRAPPPIRNESEAFRALVRRKGRTFPGEMTTCTALLLPPSRRPQRWLSSSKTISLEVGADESNATSTSSGMRSGRTLRNSREDDGWKESKRNRVS